LSSGEITAPSGEFVPGELVNVMYTKDEHEKYGSFISEQEIDNMQMVYVQINPKISTEFKDQLEEIKNIKIIDERLRKQKEIIEEIRLENVKLGGTGLDYEPMKMFVKRGTVNTADETILFARVIDKRILVKDVPTSSTTMHITVECLWNNKVYQDWSSKVYRVGDALQIRRVEYDDCWKTDEEKKNQSGENVVSQPGVSAVVQSESIVDQMYREDPHRDLTFFEKVHEEAILPTKKTVFSAGYDVFCLEDVCVDTTVKKVLHLRTGVLVRFDRLPRGTYGFLTSRSSAFSNGYVVNGIMDEDYVGEATVVLHVPDDMKQFKLVKGQAVAQLIFQKYHKTCKDSDVLVPRENPAWIKELGWMNKNNPPLNIRSSEDDVKRMSVIRKKECDLMRCEKKLKSLKMFRSLAREQIIRIGCMKRPLTTENRNKLTELIDKCYSLNEEIKELCPEIELAEEQVENYDMTDGKVFDSFKSGVRNVVNKIISSVGSVSLECYGMKFTVGGRVFKKPMAEIKRLKYEKNMLVCKLTFLIQERPHMKKSIDILNKKIALANRKMYGLQSEIRKDRKAKTLAIENGDRSIDQVDALTLDGYLEEDDLDEDVEDDYDTDDMNSDTDSEYEC
jgi:dUTPase